MQRLASLAIATFFTVGGAFACSGDEDTPDTGGEADAGGGGQDSGGAVDSGGGETVTTRCGDSFTDETASASVTITFPETSSVEQYAPNCIRVKKGTEITWEGSFANHPLDAAEGDSNTPITKVTSGTSRAFTFNGTGTFGYECTFHPAVMFGAIQVVD